MNWLVTGANGFVGRALCAELLLRGQVVRGAVRGRCSDMAVPLSSVGEVGAHTDWSGALGGVDVVVHLAARVHMKRDTAAEPLAEFRRVNVAGTEHLARSAAATGVRRLVFVSTIGVNGPTTAPDEAFSEACPPSPQNDYSLSKWEAEQALQHVAAETGLETVILRPPLVYGGGMPGNLAPLLGAISRGIPLPLASVHNRRSLLFIGNLVDALITCGTHRAAVGRTYLVCDGEDVSTAGLVEKLAAAMGRKSCSFAFPPVLLRLAALALGRRAQAEALVGSLRIDDAGIRDELGWQAPYTLEQGLKLTADWYAGQASGYNHGH